MLDALKHTPLDALLSALSPQESAALREVRVRVNRPVMARIGHQNVFLTATGARAAAGRAVQMLGVRV